MRKSRKFPGGATLAQTISTIPVLFTIRRGHRFLTSPRSLNDLQAEQETEGGT